jgi:hypothetical protein
MAGYELVVAKSAAAGLSGEAASKAGDINPTFAAAIKNQLI